jgi:hypothetical protein
MRRNRLRVSLNTIMRCEVLTAVNILTFVFWVVTSWRWRQYVPPKRLYLGTNPYGYKPQDEHPYLQECSITNAKLLKLRAKSLWLPPRSNFSENVTTFPRQISEWAVSQSLRVVSTRAGAGLRCQFHALPPLLCLLLFLYRHFFSIQHSTHFS